MSRAVIAGTFYDGERSRGRAAILEVLVDARVRVRLVDAADVAGEPAGPPPSWERALREVHVSDRLGQIPRRIELPGIGVFETRDNEAVDRAFAAHGASAGLVHWLEQRWPVAIASMIAVAIASFAFVRFGLPALAGLAARSLPAEVDEAIGARSLALLDETFFEPSRLPQMRQLKLQIRYSKMLRELGAPASQRLENRDAPGLGPNALALPSGIVVMTDDLVRLAKHDDELVAVLAHELGHVRGRHALRQLIQSAGVSALALALVGDVSQASALFGAVPALIDAKHSRDLEREADAFSKDWLSAHDIAATHFDDILCRMEQEVGGAEAAEGSKWARYLSTHPSTDERARCDVISSDAPRTEPPPSPTVPDS